VFVITTVCVCKPYNTSTKGTRVWQTDKCRIMRHYLATKSTRKWKRYQRQYYGKGNKLAKTKQNNTTNTVLIYSVTTHRYRHFLRLAAAFLQAASTVPKKRRKTTHFIRRSSPKQHSYSYLSYNTHGLNYQVQIKNAVWSEN
jgi:hypothetical protein